MSGSLKTVAAYPTPIEANLARNRLEAAGIQAFLGDDMTVGWLWHLGTALHGVKVLVAESDLSRATEILEKLKEPEPAEEPPRPWSCPKCAAEVGGEMDVCWACGTTVEGVEDPDFQHADVATTAAPQEEETGPKGPPSPGVALLVGFVVPWVLLNAVLGAGVVGDLRDASLGTGLWLLLLGACEFLVVIRIFHLFYYQPPSRAEVPDDRLQSLADTTPWPEGDRERRAIEPAAMARRACLAALLGMAFCPPLLNIYSIWLILKYELYRATVCRKSGFFVYGAIFINVFVCVVILLVVLLAGGLVVD